MESVKVCSRPRSSMFRPPSWPFQQQLFDTSEPDKVSAATLEGKMLRDQHRGSDQVIVEKQQDRGFRGVDSSIQRPRLAAMLHNQMAERIRSPEMPKHLDRTVHGTINHDNHLEAPRKLGLGSQRRQKSTQAITPVMRRDNNT